MTDLKTNILEVLSSSREPLTVPDITQDVQNWLIPSGGKRRPNITLNQIQRLVDELRAERTILPVGDGFILRRAVKVEEKQLQLF